MKLLPPTSYLLPSIAALFPFLLFLMLTAMCASAVNLPTKHECKFELLPETNHISPPSICVTNLTAGGPYTLVNSNVEVYVSGEAVTNGVGMHEIKWIPTPLICTVVLETGLICGKTNNLKRDPQTNSVAPNLYTYEWTLSPGNFGKSGDGDSFSATNLVTEPGRYTLTANFTGTRTDCSECKCEASGATNCTVYQLTVTNTLWLGLDRTDAGPTNKIGEATATLKPDDPATYAWEIKSEGEDAPVVCILKNTVENKTEYWTTNKESCSKSYLDQKLEVKADIESPIPFPISTTTNFTVVKVDVTLDGVDEEKEEAVGAFLKASHTPEFDADFDDNKLIGASNVEETWLKPIRFTCEPSNLPDKEKIKITFKRKAFLFELIGDKVQLIITKLVDSETQCFETPAKDIQKRIFYIEDREASITLGDRKVIVEHCNSGSIDIAKYTSVQIDLEPINQVLGINPCALVKGGTGQYLATSITPSVIAENMVWSVGLGNVSIINDPNNSGVTLKADMVEGVFRLNLTMHATNDYRFSTYNLPSPYITGSVREKKYVPVSFVRAGTFDGYCEKPNLAVVNKYFEQVGIEFFQVLDFCVDDINLLGLSAGYTINIVHLNYPEVYGSVPITCVPYFALNSENLLGASIYGKGIALREGSFNREYILAHELGHMCGLEDIYSGSDIEYPLSMTSIIQPSIPYDWSGGKTPGSFYNRECRHQADIIEKRLLMNGNPTLGNVCPDISSGVVTGFYEDNKYGPRKTGLLDMNRYPVVNP